ncbi:hypothetical protein XELAEV_18024545mg [Xenopus laevis]|uniref:Uncharacterized protein n=1 Tax=Xenopus laevis TaxID=8355 RepID=A0A974HLI7_XENLA|nr:hypothetical protein XELAEV_18024545mg [Xenopus laevis]
MTFYFHFILLSLSLPSISILPHCFYQGLLFPSYSTVSIMTFYFHLTLLFFYLTVFILLYCPYLALLSPHLLSLSCPTMTIFALWFCHYLAYHFCH